VSSALVASVAWSTNQPTSRMPVGRVPAVTPDVPTRYQPPSRPALSRSRLAGELRSLGVDQGDVVMVHTSMRSLGWVIGGADTVVLGLLDAVGADGTILAMAGAHNDSWYGFDRWPAALQDLYRERDARLRS
jgi:hypothetical protein